MSARTTILTLCTATVLTISAASVSTQAADPPDRGSPGWGPIRTLAPNPQSASIAVDGRGVTTAAWQSTGYPPSVVVRQRNADGTWGKRAVVGQGVEPVVVADRRGHVTAVWLTHHEGYSDGVAAARLSSGRWSAPVQLSRDVALPGYVPGAAAHGASDLDVAVDARGAVVATWAWGSEEGDVPSRIQSAFRSAAGPWRAAVNVTPATGAGEPEVGIAADGTVTVVYGLQAFGEPQKLVSRRRATTGRWGGPALVAPDSYSHDVAVVGDGATTAVFTTGSGEARAATRHAVGKWRTRTISAPGAQIGDADLAVSRRGRAVVAMSQENGGVAVVERPPGGRWSAPVRLAGGGSVVSEVVVALNAAGDTFVGWGSYALYGKYRPAGKPWSRRYTVVPDAGVEVLEWVGAITAPGGTVAVLCDQEARPLRIRVLTP